MSLRFPRSKFKAHLAALLAMVLVMSLAFVIFSLWKTWKTNIDKVESRAAYTAQMVSSLVDSNLVSALKLLSITERSMSSINFARTSDGDIHKILKTAASDFSYAQEDEAFGLLLFADASGHLLAQNVDAQLPNVNVKDRLYFEQARNPGARYSIGDLVVARVTGDLVFHIAVPVHGKHDEFEGALIQQINVKRLERLLEDSQLLSVERLAIYLPNGRLAFDYPHASTGDSAKNAHHEIFELTRGQVASRITLQTGGLNGFVAGVAKNSRFGLTTIATASMKSILLKTIKDEATILVALPIFILVIAWMFRTLYRKSVEAEEFESESGHDSLTGLYNRRGFDERASFLVREAIRNQQCVSVLFVDIDHFKRLNDAYGHQEGDCALRVLANVLHLASCRPLDLTCRWGGEEFLVLLPETEAKGAMEVAQRILIETRAQSVKTASGDHLAFTVSVGIATRKLIKPEDLTALIAQADKAMLAAKSGGRDRVAVAISES